MRLLSRSGFTIIEVILGTFILSMILIALNAAMFSHIRTSANTRSIAEATSLGNKVLEKYRMTSYSQITGSSGPVGRQFFQTSVVSADSVNRKKEIEVIVSWPDTAARHSITLKTIIAKQ